MTCQICKGLGSVIKANPSTGEFHTHDCICKVAGDLLYGVFYCERMNKKTFVKIVGTLSIYTVTSWSGNYVDEGWQNRWIFEEAVTHGEEVRLS